MLLRLGSEKIGHAVQINAALAETLAVIAHIDYRRFARLRIRF